MVSISNWLPNSVGVAFGRGPMVAFGVNLAYWGQSEHCGCGYARLGQAVVESSLLGGGSSIGGSQVGRSREVGRFSEGSLREVSHNYE